MYLLYFSDMKRFSHSNFDSVREAIEHAKVLGRSATVYMAGPRDNGMGLDLVGAWKNKRDTRKLYKAQG